MVPQKELLMVLLLVILKAQVKDSMMLDWKSLEHQKELPIVLLLETLKVAVKDSMLLEQQLLEQLLLVHQLLD